MLRYLHLHCDFLFDDYEIISLSYDSLPFSYATRMENICPRTKSCDSVLYLGLTYQTYIYCAHWL